MTCFDDDRVLRFVAGMLSLDEVSAMDGHMDSCPICFQRVLAAVTSSPVTPPRRPLPPADDGVVPGQLLADRYRVVRLLGAGASGRVFEALDQLAQVEVALKVLGAGQAADPRWSRRFVRELQLARRLDHPNICRVLNMEQAGDQRFLVMELATGSLRAELEDNRGLPWPQAMASAQAITAGLQAIHEAGILHRDVKPENVLRMPDGRLVLSDFGLATRPTGTASLTRFVGTPMYMAPELVDGDSATVASDVWSLGVVLHELFFGCRPRWQQSSRGRVFQPAAGPRPAHLANLDRRLLRLCTDCLSPLPQRRPRSASEVRGRLAEIAARPVRSRLLALVTAHGRLVVGLVAVLALGGAAATLGWRNRPPKVASKPASPPPPPSAPSPPLVLVKPDHFSAWGREVKGPGSVGVVLAPDAPIREQSLTAAAAAIEADLRTIPGVAVQIAATNPAPEGPGSGPAWIVRVGIGKEDIDKRRPSIRLESSLVGLDGEELGLSNEACPVDDVARCLQRKSAPFLRGLLKGNIHHRVGRARLRNDPCAPKARMALVGYLAALDAPEHTSGSRDPRRLLFDALDADATCFAARFELAWNAAMTGEMAARASERTAFRLEVERLRRQRPAEEEVGILQCLALTAVAVYDATSDANLEAADVACSEAARTEIENRPALFALAQLAARRCDGQTAGVYLQRLLDEADDVYPVPLFPIVARPSQAGSLLPALVVQTLAPDYDPRRWATPVAIMRGGALQAQGRDEFALNEFRRALSELSQLRVWPGSNAQLGTDLVRSVVAQRGLQKAREALGRIDVRYPTSELRAQESMLASIEPDPMSLLPYLWVDPVMLQRRLRAVPVPDGCGARIQRAMLFQAMGNRGARDAELAFCRDDGEWVRACRARLSGRIEPKGPPVKFSARAYERDAPEAP
jgi:serine/threonine protein kinase